MFLISSINSIENQIDWPTSNNLIEELRKLDFDDFVILSKEVDSEFYIQAMKDENSGFILEFREGSADAHYCLSDEYISQLQVKEALEAYLNGHFDDWKGCQNIQSVSF